MTIDHVLKQFIEKMIPSDLLFIIGKARFTHEFFFVKDSRLMPDIAEQDRYILIPVCERTFPKVKKADPLFCKNEIIQAKIPMRKGKVILRRRMDRKPIP